MQESGGFKLIMKTAAQAEQVFPIIQEEISIYEYWMKNIKFSENIISVDSDTHMYTSEYPGVVLNFCKAIAIAHPDFEYSIVADCCDDEGFFSCSEKGKLQKGKFNHVITTCEMSSEQNYDDIDWDNVDSEDMDDFLDELEGEEVSTTETITGEIIDGVMQFKLLGKK